MHTTDATGAGAGVTLGRRQLLTALQTTSRAALAGRMNVSAMAISWWASGKRTPTYRYRVALREAIGAALDSWDIDEQHFETSVSQDACIVGA